MRGAHHMEGIKHLQSVDYAVIAGYFIIIIFAGSYFTRYIKQSKDYFTAGAVIPWWLGSISLWMATFSSLGFVMYAELGYKFGFTIMTLYFLGIPAKILGGMFLAKRWRRARQMSPIGFIESRYSPSLRQIFVWTGFPLRILDNSVRLYATGIFLSVALSSDVLTLTPLIILTGVIILGYSFLGGQWSVIVTDFVQFIIICLAVFILLPLTVREMGGLGTFFASMPDDFASMLHEPYDLFQVCTLVVLYTLTFNAGWGIIQKYNCVKSDRDAPKVSYAVAAWQFLTPFLFFTPAIFARVIMPEIDNARYAYAYISFKVLPVGLMGVMIAAIFSATMSTLSNEYTMLSSVLTNEFYAKKINTSASDKRLVFVARINSLIVGILTTALAISFQYVQGFNLFDIMVKSFTAFSPAIMAPLLGGLLVRRINARGALAGIVGGFTSGSVLLVLNVILVGVYHEQFMANPRLNYWLNQGWTSASIIINIAITVGGLWLGSVLKKTPEEEQVRADEFFRMLDTPYETDTSETVRSPFPVIGIIVAVMGAGMTVVAFTVKAVYNNSEWFVVNMIAAAALLVIGGGVWWLSKASKSQTTKSDNCKNNHIAR